MPEQNTFFVLIGIILFLYVYPFFVYPILLCIFTFFERQASVKDINTDKELPFVSVIITAFNEAASIGKKIDNTLSLHYPMEKLEIIVVSDGSFDSTTELARKFNNPNVHVIELKERKGKTYAQNAGVNLSKGEVLVFSDANTILDKSAIRSIVSWLFSSDKIGCVSGNLIYLGNKRSFGEVGYQRYDTLIKRLESRFFSAIGVNGAFYALRRRDFVILPDDIISDFVEPLEIYRVHRKVTVFCENARCFEEAPYKDRDIKSIFERKSRIVVRGLRGLFYVKELLNPVKHPIMSFELISHKFMRWASVWLLLLMYLLPLFWHSSLGIRVFAVESLLILLIIMLYLTCGRVSKGSPVIGTLFYFVSLIPADILAWYYFISGKSFKTWTTKR